MSDVAEVALKEATEESGLSALHLPSSAILDIDIHRIPARKMNLNISTMTVDFLSSVGVTIIMSSVKNPTILPGYR